MLEYDIHHLPVDDGGGVIGVITDTDLMDLDRGSPFAIRSAIERARSTVEVVFAARGYPARRRRDGRCGRRPARRVPRDLGDRRRRDGRLLSLASRRSASRPARTRGCRSAARRGTSESLHSDQDHALALGDGFVPDEHDVYFADLAERVTAGLEAIGFPRCRGDAMAVHRAMRASLDDWAERFRTWIQPARRRRDDPVLDRLRLPAGRRHAGRRARARRRRGRRAPRTAVPAAARAWRSARNRRPGSCAGSWSQSKGKHAGRLDIKHGGVTIVTSIARARAIAAGAPVKDTLARLRAAVDGGHARPDSGADLAEAFRFLSRSSAAASGRAGAGRRPARRLRRPARPSARSSARACGRRSDRSAPSSTLLAMELDLR